MIAGAISFGEGFNARSVAISVASNTDRYATLDMYPVVQKTGIAVFSMLRRNQLQRAEVTSDEGVCLVGDCNYSPVDEGRRAPIAKDGDSLQNDPKGRQIGVKYLPEKESVQFTTDYLGTMWLFVGRAPEGFVFGTDFGAVARQLHGELSVNKEKALLELLFGSFADDETVFNEIVVAPPGAMVTMGRDGSYEVSRDFPEYGSRYVNSSDSEKYAALDEIFQNIVEGMLLDYKDRLILSLSTGYDSRYGLALLKKHGFDFDCHTFGHPDSLEVFGAERVARKAGVTTGVFPQPDSNWDSWREFTIATGTSGTIQWCGWCQDWARYLAARGNSVMIGYLGDAMSGVRLNYNDQDAAGWLSNWILRWGQWNSLESDSGPHFIREKWRKAAFDVAYSRAESSLIGIQFKQPHQKAQYLNLYGRQRRHVASQAHLLNYFLTPLTYLYDRELLDFSANVSLDDLDNQRLYLSYAHSRFPDLFTRDNKQVSFSILERIGNKLRATAQKARGRAVSVPSVLDRNKIILPNRKEILDLADRVDPISSEIIDTERFREEVKSYSAASYDRSGSIIMTTNLLQLLDLASGKQPAEDW